MTHIRWMIRRDLPEVLQIETNWTEEDFLSHLRQRNEMGMVAECGEKVVGYMLYALHKTRIELLNFAVHPQWRRQGIGMQMVIKLIGKLANQRRTRITLKVHETNLPAQLFFRSQGFRALRILHESDEYLMAHCIKESKECTVVK